MIRKNLCGSLSGCLFLLLLTPAKAGTNDTDLSEFSSASETAVQGEDLVRQGFQFGPELLVDPKKPNRSLEIFEYAGASDAAIENDWVANSLLWLGQFPANQSTQSVSAVQIKGTDLVPSSTNSEHLEPIESAIAGEAFTQLPSDSTPHIAQATSTQGQLEQWHFLLVPYVYVPFFISGSADYEGSEGFQNNFSRDFDGSATSGGSRDFEFTPTQIRTSLENSLNFAFLGEIEAWTPNYTVGVLANFDYLSLSSDETLNRSVRRPGFAEFIPTEINASLNTQVWTADLAASYRFYDRARVNPQGLDTEFDLGPFVFDAVGGLSVASVNTQLGLSTNLGGDGEFTTSNTVVSPLLGGRFRWNATPKLAVLVSGTVSGFGIGGLTQYGVLGGVDWMFSGNTTLGLGYRAGFLDYSSGSSEVDLNVDQHGPYLNFGFRF